ncbi:MAG: DUF2157 domain-containing protein [Oligoflexales bacterium]|nr:DUF2157 domain-containing protein [Oligoflexales bacterium]
MIFLERKLAQWQKAGLIDQAQYDAIKVHEESSTQNKSWAIWGAAVIGISAIVIGIVSIVAANWRDIPGEIKLLSYFLSHSVLAFYAWKNIEKPGLIRETLLTLFCLLFLVGIGLTAQVFHIISDGWSGLLFWCGLSLPVVLYAQSRFINYIWLLILLTAQVIWTIDTGIGTDKETIHALWFFATLSLYTYLALGILCHTKIKLPVFFREALRNIPFFIIFICGSALATIFWYFGYGESDLKKLTLDNFFPFKFYYSPWLGCLLVSAALYFREKPIDKLLFKLLLLFFGLLALFYSLPLVLELKSNKVLGTIFAVVTWGCLALAAARAGWRRAFDFLTLCITLRFLVVYFEVFGSMLATGIGLLITGVIILGVTFVWYSYRQRMLEKFRVGLV